MTEESFGDRSHEAILDALRNILRKNYSSVAPKSLPNPPRSSSDFKELNLVFSGHASEVRDAALSQEIRPQQFPSANFLVEMPVCRLVCGCIELGLGTVQLQVNSGLLLNNRFLYLLRSEQFMGKALHRILVAREPIEKYNRLEVCPERESPIYRGANGQWYVAGYDEYEFLFPHPVSLSDCSGVSFSSHNDPFCLKYGDYCHQNNADKAVCELVALAIAHPELTAIRSIFRSQVFYAGPELMIPFAIELRSMERRRSAERGVVSESMLHAAFVELGMGNWLEAEEILCRTDKEQITQYLVQRFDLLLAQPVGSAARHYLW